MPPSPRFRFPLPSAPRRALLAGLVISSLTCTACTGGTVPATAPATAPAASLPINLPPGVPAIHFDSVDMTLRGKKFAMEVAESDPQIERGLMYRPSMPANHGMLFVFNTPQDVGFWMKNTQIPLDIVFIDPQQKVIEIHNRKPFDETGMGPSRPALWVIELNAGTARQIGLQPGDTVSIPAKYLKR